MNVLDTLPLDNQDHWLILQGSLQRRVAHLPRCGMWEQVGKYMITNTQADTTHSSAAKPCIHNNAHMVSTDIASTVKQTITKRCTK
jgi:hypothetical protein